MLNIHKLQSPYRQTTNNKHDYLFEHKEKLKTHFNKQVGVGVFNNNQNLNISLQ